jgi:hypothetical protein
MTLSFSEQFTISFMFILVIFYGIFLLGTSCREHEKRYIHNGVCLAYFTVFIILLFNSICYLVYSTYINMEYINFVDTINLIDTKISSKGGEILVSFSSISGKCQIFNIQPLCKLSNALAQIGTTLNSTNGERVLYAYTDPENYYNKNVYPSKNLLMSIGIIEIVYISLYTLLSCYDKTKSSYYYMTSFFVYMVFASSLTAKIVMSSSNDDFIIEIMTMTSILNGDYSSSYRSPTKEFLNFRSEYTKLFNNLWETLFSDFDLTESLNLQRLEALKSTNIKMNIGLFILPYISSLLTMVIITKMHKTIEDLQMDSFGLNIPIEIE